MAAHFLKIRKATLSSMKLEQAADVKKSLHFLMQALGINPHPRR